MELEFEDVLFAVGVFDDVPSALFAKAAAAIDLINGNVCADLGRTLYTANFDINRESTASILDFYAAAFASVGAPSITGRSETPFTDRCSRKVRADRERFACSAQA